MVWTEIGAGVETVAGSVGQAVVGLGGRWGMGSGFVIDDGRVLTNAHNVSSDEPRVSFPDGRTATGRVLGVDIDHDLALIEVATNGSVGVEWAGEVTAPRIGTPVFGLANPGGRGLRVTTGLVAATDRAFRGPRGKRVPGGFEHTAPAPSGASGGPVVGTEGGLLGINTRRLGRGFYLAQTAGADLRSLVEALGRGEQPEPRRLGVGLAPGEVARRLRRTMGLEEVEGLLVRLVEEGSPAATAGVREGDVLVSAGGQEVADIDDLHRHLAGAGEEIVLGLVRVNDRLDVTVVFG